MDVLTQIKPELPTIYNLLIKHLPVGNLPASAAIDAERLFQSLQSILMELLQNDFQQLLQFMYRVDVPQTAFEQAMQAPSLTEIAHQLTELTLLRELKKAQFRKL